MGIVNFFSCVATMGITGSIGCILFLFAGKLLPGKYSEFKLYWIESILLLFLIPVVYGIMRMSRLVYCGGSWVNKGAFGVSTTLEITGIFKIVMIVWLTGLLAGVLICVYQYLRLKVILRRNIPVMDERWYDIFREICEKYGLKRVQICNNDMVAAPFVANSFFPTVVIPMKEYTEKEMRMVLDHELKHIYSHDLVWKKAALLVSWLHWCNLFTHMLLRWLSLAQETECDIYVCQNTDDYTAKEYCEFIMSMGEGMRNQSYIAALFETKSVLLRRMEILKERRNEKNIRKWIVLVTCLLFVGASSLPAYAVSEQLAQAEERWMESTAIEIEDTENTVKERTEYVETDNGPWREMKSPETDEFSYIYMEAAAEPGVKYGYKSKYLKAGDEVNIAVACSDSEASFCVGLRNADTKECRYIVVENSAVYVFAVEEEGVYQVYIENKSESEVEISGVVLYSK